MAPKKPKTIQESFPEICSAIGEQSKNVEIKAKFAKKTCCPTSETFLLCQVLQDTQCPQKVTIIKETFIKCEDGKDDPPPLPECKDQKEDQKSLNYIYCREVVEPHLDPEGKSPDELACEAVEAASRDFPQFQYCCSASKKSPPLMLNPNVLKNPPAEGSKPAEDVQPACKANGASLKDTASCIMGALCKFSKAASSKAQCCFNDLMKKKKSKDSDDEDCDEKPKKPKCW